jgi:hypothetical protein
MMPENIAIKQKSGLSASFSIYLLLIAYCLLLIVKQTGLGVRDKKEIKPVCASCNHWKYLSKLF